VPAAIKDLFWTKDAPMAAVMAVYRDFRPGQDATAVARLRDVAAIVSRQLRVQRRVLRILGLDYRLQPGQQLMLLPCTARQIGLIRHKPRARST
jgi:Amidase